MHGIFRSDAMLGTTVAPYTVSVRYAPSSTNTAIDNGCFVALGAYETGSREVRVGATPTANTALKSLAVIGSPEVDKTVKYNTLGNFENKAGDVATGYKLHEGDSFSLTADAFDIAVVSETAITPTVGTSILEAQAGVKGILVNSATSGSTKIADLVAIETDGATTWYVFRV